VSSLAAADSAQERSIGLLRATGIGVGAIVGGGILALAGVAYAHAGPAAIVAFALNGVIAVLTALSFAEMSSVFPESGGTYAFAKKVLSLEAAFTIGWVVWFASIVAGVLYALGFAAYAAILIEQLWPGALGAPTDWLTPRQMEVFLAMAATVAFTFSLLRKSTGGGQWATAGKVILFAVLIAGGLWVLGGSPAGTIAGQLSPFLPRGAFGLFEAMGYTFIALQGFDLIAAVGGEVRDPARTIPRAMLLSLAAALAIYLPLLLIIATVGVPAGQSITAASAAQPETMVAVAARNFLGPVGFWLVIVAAILSMLSALQANLFAASRVALSMARDRTLPHVLGRLHDRRATPVAAILTSAVTLAIILLAVPDVAAAGAAASLIFLISFALTHWTNILARLRGSRRAPFHVPWFPLIPATGGLACVGLAVFQGISVPSAGVVAALWLAIGGVLFLSLFARRARIVDAGAEALDPRLVQLRGRNPLVLVPIANPANAAVMVAIANALAPPAFGRVLLLSVVVPPQAWRPGEPLPRLLDVQAVLGGALAASFAAGLAPEALTTVSAHPWTEITRVARIHRCESLLLGLTSVNEEVIGTQIENTMSQVDCDVVVLRAKQDWQFSEVRRVLVPVGGRGGHDVLLARLLGSLCRTGAREITFLRVLPQGASDLVVAGARRLLTRFAVDQVPGPSRVEVVRNDSISAEITRRAAASDLVILGSQRLGRRQKLLGDMALRVARDSSCAIILISRRG